MIAGRPKFVHRRLYHVQRRAYAKAAPAPVREEMLDTTSVCKLLSISRHCLHDMLYIGEFPVGQRVHRSGRSHWTKKEIDEWLKLDPDWPIQ